MKSTDVTSTAYLGIDVAKEKVDCVLLVEQQSGYQVFANTPVGFEQLGAWLRREQVYRVHACLEATGSYSDALARALLDQGHMVSILNPAVLVTYRQSRNTRSKTDKLDAMVLAHYARERQPRAWHPLPDEVLALRSLLAYRSDVQQTVLQARNRQRSGGLESWVAARLQTQIELLVKEFKLVEERIWKHLETSTTLSATWSHLQTICGIGQLAAAHVIAQIGEIERFDHPAALVSLAGLAVKQRESGSSLRGRAQMDRHGRGSLRRLLYMCALVAMRWDPHMRAWAQQLKTRGKPSKVVLVAVMRKLLHIIYGVWKNARDFDAQLAFPARA
jgi:transposase